MLVDFTLRNFLSFKEEVSFSMLAAKSVKEHDTLDSHIASNTISIPNSDSKLLKVAAIYGANGSGKSNLLSAMSFFKHMVLDSFKDDSILRKAKDLSYQFSIESHDEPNSFEMTFIIKDKRYRYGFEIFNNSVDSEWLFIKPLNSIRESYCFRREKKNITVNSKTFKGSSGIASKTRHNALFLSTCAQFNVEVSMTIKEWFRKRFNILSGFNDDTIHYTAGQYIHNADMHNRIIKFIKLIDLGINNIQIKESDVEDVPETVNKVVNAISKNPNIINSEITDIKKIEILSEHKRYNHEKWVDNLLTPFSIESLGTKKIFALLGPWFDTIINGGTLLIDEFGASFHTKLSFELIKVFQSNLNNDAQLIITTHDTNLLRNDLFRRDQIWFAEKNEFGVSDIYSLVEYKINQANSVRNDATFNKDYLLGKYGAIPYFGNISQFLNDFSNNGK
ncbi:MAG: ATP-binding protein [Muribaculaceae bacterium]|nr:ATP-binding protein [Muribaculaceae bacterium]